MTVVHTLESSFIILKDCQRSSGSILHRLLRFTKGFKKSCKELKFYNSGNFSSIPQQHAKSVRSNSLGLVDSSFHLGKGFQKYKVQKYCIELNFGGPVRRTSG